MRGRSLEVFQKTRNAQVLYHTAALSEISCPLEALTYGKRERRRLRDPGRRVKVEATFFADLMSSSRLQPGEP